MKPTDVDYQQTKADLEKAVARLAEVIQEKDDLAKGYQASLDSIRTMIDQLQTKVDEKLRSIMSGNFTYLVDSYRSQIFQVFDDHPEFKKLEPEKAVEAVKQNERIFWSGKFFHWAECREHGSGADHLKAQGFRDCARVLLNNSREL